MKRFCTNCGQEIASGMAFCTECGAKVPEAVSPAVTETKASETEVKTENPTVHTQTVEQPEVNQQPQIQQQQPQPQQVQPQPQPAQPQPQQAQPQQQPVYNQQAYRQPVYQQPAYQQPVYQQPAVPQAIPTADASSKPVGTGAFFGLMLLFALPIIGFIACIIMCFAPKNKSLKNFARATLIWLIIGLIIGGLIIGGIFLLTNSLIEYIGELTEGQIEDYGGSYGQSNEFSDLFDQLGDLESLMEQFQNGGLDGLPIE